ncbi:hypothetical protein SAMN04487866_12617 [Thermoactinomyces sp. DSM 45891]|uniref:hypothetical protein n=1 Tax=Thermoactinomyces sp. DSM 45891 TaxID=1761907 RepID=UPI00090F2EB5|nr:hypothetical protein [Thermoactinomyces sp. DSM 45891]SFX79372.1 hypothetical protein SAMN04487866_12617 [Thermoactinomyces sp. DSM 45891]
MMNADEMELYLVEKGVSSEHIQVLKNEIVQGMDSDLQECFEYVETVERLIPVDKIVSLPRFRRGRDGTWWDHFNCQAGSIVEVRIESLRRSMEQKGLESFIHSFSLPKYKVRGCYYPRLDQYYIEQDGTHRTLWAKVVDAPYIYARVEIYKLVKEKYRNYLMLLSLKESWYELLRKCHLSWHYDNNMVMYGDKEVFKFYRPPSFSGDDVSTQIIKEKYKRNIGIFEKCLHLDRYWKKRIRNRELRYKIIKNIVCPFIELRDKGYVDSAAYRLLISLYESDWEL